MEALDFSMEAAACRSRTSPPDSFLLRILLEGNVTAFSFLKNLALREGQEELCMHAPADRRRHKASSTMI